MTCLIVTLNIQQQHIDAVERPPFLWTSLVYGRSFDRNMRCTVDVSVQESHFWHPDKLLQWTHALHHHYIVIQKPALGTKTQSATQRICSELRACTWCVMRTSWGGSSDKWLIVCAEKWKRTNWVMREWLNIQVAPCATCVSILTGSPRKRHVCQCHQSPGFS